MYHVCFLWLLSSYMWTSLEITRLVVSILIPLSVVTFGWIINQRLKRFEHKQWANQKLIEKRLELYDQLAPQLNKLLCFYVLVGGWKSITPSDVRETKRSLDQCVHIYRYLLGEPFFETYQAFINQLFAQWQGSGVSALLKTPIQTDRGDRKTDSDYEWKPEWESWFAEDQALSYMEIEVGYAKVMNALKDTILIYQ